MAPIDGIALNDHVKNTFIHVPVPAHMLKSPRRSTSVPPGLRLLQPTETAASTSTDDPFSIRKRPSWADASTDASEEDWSPSDSAHGNNSDAESGDPSDCSPCESAAFPMGTRLSSKAAPWQPQAQCPLSDPLPYTYGQESAHVLTILKKALMDTKLPQSIDVINKPGGWLVSIQMWDMSQRSRERAIHIAKKTLLEAISGTSCTYILGYHRRPFVTQPNGFSTLFGAMRDENQACWDAYCKGYCNGRCELQHPACRMQVDVQMWM